MARRIASGLLLLASALVAAAPAPARAGPYAAVKFGGYLPTSGDLQGDRGGFAFEADGGLPLGPVLALELGAAVYQVRVNLTSPSGAGVRAPLYGVTVPLSLRLAAPAGALEVQPWLEAGVSWHRVDVDASVAHDHDSALGFHAGTGLCLGGFLASVRWFQAKVDLLGGRPLRVDGLLLMLGLRVGR